MRSLFLLLLHTALASTLFRAPASSRMSVYGPGHDHGIRFAECHRGELPFTQKYWVLGFNVSESRHVHDDIVELYIVLDGVGTMTLGGSTSELRAGDSVRVPIGVPHFLRNSGAGELRIMMLWWHYNWYGCARPGLRGSHWYDFLF